MNRRKFIEFLGAGGLSYSISGGLPMQRLWLKPLVNPLEPSDKDAFLLAKGLEYDILIKWGDPITDKLMFGFNNDYTAFLPDGPDAGILWVNHEYTDPLFLSGTRAFGRSLKDVRREQESVGGSALRIERSGGKWEIVPNAPVNNRLTARTKIPFNWPEKIAGKKSAIGTLANCSGGVTPWGTFLSCEENYDMFYGERDFKTGAIDRSLAGIGWFEHFDYPPEHYGWVVEYDPMSGEAQKHVALGRCAHESATVAALEDGRVVVYTGDDSINQCLYKFVSSRPGTLNGGTLYVANVPQGKWIAVDHGSNRTLNKLFRDQTEVLIRLREAARMIGGTPLDRPEDIDIDPLTGDVFISLTNNAATGNFFGSILKITEEGGRYDAMTFKAETFLTGGEDTGFACPDNMGFDRAGNLWFASDISGSVMHRDPYTAFKNNGLFVVPRSGPQAGEVLQVGSAPRDAELTGLTFSPDGKTLFLCVQHPGEMSEDLDQLTSHWPGGGDATPRSAVVTIQGELLNTLLGV